MENNPLLERPPLPAFDRIQTQHVVSAVEKILQLSHERLTLLEAKIETGQRMNWANLIEEINMIEYEISRTWGPVNHLMGVKNEEPLRRAFETVQPEIIKFFLRLGQSEKLYQAYQKLDKELSQEISSGNENKEIKIQKRILALRLREAKHSGVGLSGKSKERFNEIATELSHASTLFANHVLDSTKAFTLDLFHPSDVEGLPTFALEMAAQNYRKLHSPVNEVQEIAKSKNHSDSQDADSSKMGWTISLDGPSFMSFMQHAKHRKHRETIYKAAITRASSLAEDSQNNNTGLIVKILRLRKEQSKLLGFQNYAEQRIDTRMAKNVKEVYELLETLRKPAFEIAKKELEELRKLARELKQEEELEPWDVPYYAERLRERLFDFTEEELRSYFTLDKVLDGLFLLSKNLFHINIVAENESKDNASLVSKWHPDVRFFKIYDETNKHIASFYLDPYSRPENKRGGAWMDDCIGRKRLGGKLELPVAYLVCNAAPPLASSPGIEKKPALMNFREVETLFHEFGHGLQHLLTQIEYPDVAGINGIEWDAVEFPSQFMENWCYHKPCLLSLSSHYKTGAPLPPSLFDKIKNARNFRSASMTLRQVRLALLDMELHTKFDIESKEEDLFEIQAKVEKLTATLPSLAEDRFLCTFNHIFAGGYAAGYYSYKWAEVLAADAFSAFEEALTTKTEGEKQSLNPRPISNQFYELGLLFRNTVLALGGSLDPNEVFQSFRGRAPNAESLLRQTGLL